jgi:MOSC domain-containing protein YiiM
MGTLRAIWIKRMKLGPMDAVPTARLIAGCGIVGCANQGGRRQVTILDEDVWNAITGRLGIALSPRVRRANLLVAEFPLVGARGRIVKIGKVRIRILGETKPCERMDEAFPGLKDALYPNWGGGAFGEVLNDGEIAVGRSVEWDIESTPFQDSSKRIS